MVLPGRPRVLDPQSRRLLLDALRPPDGYRLDFAIGTTFTLDLLALLTVPLGFTGFSPEGEVGADVPPADPLLLLRTLRLYADRLSVFCQAGRISAPRAGQLLFASLEEAVIPVAAPTKGGVFHPKLWVLRFLPDQEADENGVRYRVICLSRNLTFDRSWDSVLVLDGQLMERTRAYATNRPLADFVLALPKLAIRKEVPSRTIANVRTAGDELLRVNFECPEPFTEHVFWPLGLEGHRKWPFGGRIDRMLVVSPFLTPGTIARLAKNGEDHVLVSRMDELPYISKAQLSAYATVLAMEPKAGSELQADDSPEVQDSTTSGLHAKIFVADGGRDASVWTGSANATDAAFTKNVEFLVELGGPKGACGIDALLTAEKGNTCLRDLLVPFQPLPTAVECDEIVVQLEELVGSVRTRLSEILWTARVTGAGSDQCQIDLAPDKGVWPAPHQGTSVRCWPITLTDIHGRPVEPGIDALTFGPLTLEALTTFFAFEVDAQIKDRVLRSRFVIPARLLGAPADRQERLLQYHLRDPERLIRFLLLLLTDDIEEQGESSGDDWSFGNAFVGQTGDTQSLLEPLLRALYVNPRALDEVARTVDALKKGEGSEKVFPPGFDDVWNAVWEARKRVGPPRTSGPDE